MSNLDFNTVLEPSAPSLENLEEDMDRKRRKVLRTNYLFLSGQMTLFSVICCLFVYIPHLRKVFRKDIFDKVFLSSFIGIPLAGLMLLLAVFPSLRRKFAFSALIIITMSLAFLLSYVMTRDNALSMMMSVLTSNGSSMAMLGLSFLPFIDMTKKKGMIFPPLVTLVGNLVYPSVVHGTKYTSSIVPTLVTSGLMTHLSVNCTRSLHDDNLDELSSSSPGFAFAQMYMRLGIYEFFRDAVRKRRTTAYRPISD